METAWETATLESAWETAGLLSRVGLANVRGSIFERTPKAFRNFLGTLVLAVVRQRVALFVVELFQVANDVADVRCFVGDNQVARTERIDFAEVRQQPLNLGDDVGGDRCLQRDDRLHDFRLAEFWQQIGRYPSDRVDR